MLATIVEGVPQAHPSYRAPFVIVGEGARLERRAPAVGSHPMPRPWSRSERCALRRARGFAELDQPTYNDSELIFLRAGG